MFTKKAGCKSDAHRGHGFDPRPFPMNHFDLFQSYEGRLKDRIAALQKKLNTIHMLVGSDDSEPRQLQATPAPIQFYDQNWRAVLEKTDQKQYLEALQLFCEQFNDVINEKVEISELTEKADRHHVDNLIRNVIDSVQNVLETAEETEYSSLRDELQQIHNNIETIKIHFDQNVELVHKELGQIRRSLINPVTDLQQDVPQPVQERYHSHASRVNLLAFNQTPPIKRVSLYREKYRKKKRPFQPAIDDVPVSGSVLGLYRPLSRSLSP